MGVGIKKLRVAPATAQDHLHALAGRAAKLRPDLAVVVIQPEGVEGLVPQVQQGGQLRDLLLLAERLQAGAHFGSLPAPVVAEGAEGGLVQGVGGIAGLVEQGGLLVLEG